MIKYPWTETDGELGPFPAVQRSCSGFFLSRSWGVVIDGFGPGSLFFANGATDYIHEERNLSLEVGGSVSNEFSNGQA